MFRKSCKLYRLTYFMKEKNSKNYFDISININQKRFMLKNLIGL